MLDPKEATERADARTLYEITKRLSGRFQRHGSQVSRRGHALVEGAFSNAE